MSQHVEQQIVTRVSTDFRGLPCEWEMELDAEDGDAWRRGFRAWGRNRSFVPKWVSVARHSAPPDSDQPPTIALAVRSRIRSDHAPIYLELPWVYATALARNIVKAARSLDHDALDAIAALLDGRQWNGADDLETIATLLRRTGRPVRDVAEAAPPD